MNANQRLTWSAIYDPETRQQLRPDYCLVLQRLALRFNRHPGEIENTIYYQLAPSISPNRSVHKRTFESMGDLERYLGTVLRRIFYKQVRPDMRLLSLNASLDEDGSSLGELLADPGTVDPATALEAGERIEGTLAYLRGIACDRRDVLAPLAASLLARKDQARIRQVDLARELGVHQSTVCRRLEHLAKRFHGTVGR